MGSNHAQRHVISLIMPRYKVVGKKPSSAIWYRYKSAVWEKAVKKMFEIQLDLVSGFFGPFCAHWRWYSASPSSSLSTPSGWRHQPLPGIIQNVVNTYHWKCRTSNSFDIMFFDINVPPGQNLTSNTHLHAAIRTRSKFDIRFSMYCWPRVH